MASSEAEWRKKHEAFKSRLVDDVFGKESKLGSKGGRTIPMEKVTMLIWQFRDDPAVVQFMAQFIAKVSLLSISLSRA